MNDLISRQAAIEWCRPEDWGTPDERWRPESEYGAMLEALPSVQPERKHGEWLVYPPEPFGEWTGWKCSLCGNVTYEQNFDYCPYCGSRMYE